MAYDGIAFNFRTRAHAAEFRHVHKTVFKDGFSDKARPFRHQVQQRELRLHIGRECRVRRGTDIDRLRSFAVHVQTNPVLAHFDIRASIAQFRQYCVQSVRLRVTAEDFAARDRCRHQKVPVSIRSGSTR